MADSWSLASRRPTSPKVLSAISARIPTSLKGIVMSLTIGMGLIFAAIGPLFFGFAAAAGWLASLPAVIVSPLLRPFTCWPNLCRERRDGWPSERAG